MRTLDAPPEIPPGAELLTYAEAGERLGVDPESIKRRAQRGRWVRLAGNDGRTRVAVPAELLSAASAARDDTAAAVTGDTAGASPPRGLEVLAGELVRLAADLRQARALADARLSEAATARAELERLAAAAAEVVPFAARQAPPIGYRVERNRLDGSHRWRRLADGSAGPPVVERWSAWRGAWAEHRRQLEAAAEMVPPSS